MLRVSAVSYLNTFPFVYGLTTSPYHDHFNLQLDVPSICAEKMKNSEADLSLVPVGALSELEQYDLLPSYCIGAVKEVKTVLLLSQCPLGEIKRIYLDFDSRTSVELVRVLSKYYWNINPVYEKLKAGETDCLDRSEALVAIGDKTFTLRPKYKYIYDLSSEWIRFTQLPFVFAVWVRTRRLSQESIKPFNDALAYGVSHIDNCLDFFKNRLPANVDCKTYLKENISYPFDQQKQQGLDKFLGLIRK